MMTGLDLGPGQEWAYPRGVDARLRALARYMGNLALAEFLELATAVQDHAPDRDGARRWKDAVDVLIRLVPTAVRMVLTHPVSIFWVRSTSQLLSATLRGGPVPPHTSGHLQVDDACTASHLTASLNLISELMLAAHMVAGEETEIRLAANKILCLSGALFSLNLPEVACGKTLVASVRRASGGFRLRLEGPRGFALEDCFVPSQGWIMPADAETDPLGHWLPTVQTSECVLEIDNRNPRIVRNWVSAAAYSNLNPVLPVLDCQLSGWPGLLNRAFCTLRECCPLVESEFGILMRTIVPVQGNRLGHGISCSNREFWGAMQCSEHPGIAMAEVLAHEYRHNLLNALLEADPVLARLNPGECLCYSPWRPDPRPPLGVLHGIFAFTEVAAFNLAYIMRFGDRAPEASAAEQRVIFHARRLQMALVELAAAAEFTRFGAELVTGLKGRVDQIVSDASGLNPQRWEAARTESARHYAEWQERNGRKARGEWCD